jgi:hypothetical protein
MGKTKKKINDNKGQYHQNKELQTFAHSQKLKISKDLRSQEQQALSYQ